MGLDKILMATGSLALLQSCASTQGPINIEQVTSNISAPEYVIETTQPEPEIVPGTEIYYEEDELFQAFRIGYNINIEVCDEVMQYLNPTFMRRMIRILPGGETNNLGQIGSLDFILKSYTFTPLEIDDINSFEQETMPYLVVFEASDIGTLTSVFGNFGELIEVECVPLSPNYITNNN